MDAKKDGGPAFPRVQTDILSKGHHDTYSVGGMSLRDWFAGQALAGLTQGASGSIFSMDGLMALAEEQKCSPNAVVADAAYAFADAMLAARARP